MADRIVHIGFPKCGSSTLQQRFSNLTALDYLGPSSLSNATSELTIVEENKFTILHDRIVNFILDASLSEQDVLHLASSLNTLLPESFVFSSEWITGVRYIETPLEERLRRLRLVFDGDVEVFFVFRPHIEMLASMYRDNPISFVDSSFVNFSCFVRSFFANNLHRSLSFKYIYETLVAFFGPNRVHSFVLNHPSELDVSSRILNHFDLECSQDNYRRRFNSGSTFPQFLFRSVARNFSFLKIVIPEKILLKAYTYVLSALGLVGRACEIDVTTDTALLIKKYFEEDWIFAQNICS